MKSRAVLLDTQAAALILCADLIAAGHARIERTVLVLHATPEQAGDLLAASDLANGYTTVDGHVVHNAWLLNWGPIRIVADRTAEPEPEVRAAFGEPWPFEATADEAERILHAAGVTT